MQSSNVQTANNNMILQRSFQILLNALHKGKSTKNDEEYLTHFDPKFCEHLIILSDIPPVNSRI